MHNNIYYMKNLKKFESYYVPGRATDSSSIPNSAIQYLSRDVKFDDILNTEAGLKIGDILSKSNYLILIFNDRSILVMNDSDSWSYSSIDDFNANQKFDKLMDIHPSTIDNLVNKYKNLIGIKVGI